MYYIGYKDKLLKKIMFRISETAYSTNFQVAISYKDLGKAKCDFQKIKAMSEIKKLKIYNINVEEV